jgi:hypothetical protein
MVSRWVEPMTNVPAGGAVGLALGLRLGVSLGVSVDVAVAVGAFMPQKRAKRPPAVAP